MIITGLRIKNFGKFGDFSVEFGDNLNVICGDNEAGKTTIIAFIKAMLYGMSSRKRDIRVNDRLRFQPWNGEFGEGELYCKNEKGHVHLIKRKLGNDRHDSINVSDVLTGKRISHYETASPGGVMLGLGEGAYTRTIYVPQLGCMISPDKDDEIMSRLMNLQDTGEEQVSLQKALNSIEKERKRLTIRSGSGKLDSLRDILEKLRNERRNVQKLHDENIDDQLQLNCLLSKKVELEKRINKWDEIRKNLKRRKAYLEYLELKKLQDELDALQDELQMINKQLLCGDSGVDSQFLQEVQTSLIDWKNKDKQLKDLQKEIKEKSGELENTAAILNEFSGFNDIEDNVDTQVLLKEQNKEILSEKLLLCEQLRTEKEVLDKELAAKRSDMGSLSLFSQLSRGDEELIAEKEELKRKLEEEQKNDLQVDTLRRDIIRDKLKNIQLLKALGFVGVVAGIVTGAIYNQAFYIASFFGVLTVFYGLNEANKLKTALAEIEDRISDYRSQSIKKKLDEAVADLSSFYQQYGAFDSQDFAAKRRRFEVICSDIAVIESKISDRLSRYDAEEEEEFKKQLKECTAYLQNIITTTGCSSLDDFSEKQKAFLRYKSSYANLARELEELQSKYDNLFSVVKSIEGAISGKLYLEPGNSEISGKAEILMKEYEVRLTRRDGILIRIETNLKNFQERLAGRNLAELSVAALDDSAHDQIGEEIEEEGIASRLHDLNEERLELAKKLTGLEGAINNRFKDVRDISAIEEQIDSVDFEIRRYEEILEALDLTKNMLTESFEELQNSFGPILSNNAGNILKKITRGKYSDVRVDENYHVTVKDQTAWPRDLEFFSCGTLDQVYFALRLGIVALAYENNRTLPLILDDAFVQYDDQRLAAVLNYLLEYAKDHQVLLFTCHRREAELLQDQKFNYINLQT